MKKLQNTAKITVEVYQGTDVEGLIDNFEEALLRNEYAETDSGDTYTALKEARDALKAALLSTNNQA